MAVEGKDTKSRRINDDEGEDRIKVEEETVEEEEEDRISSLPDDIIIGILSCLPLRSAIVTGVLSTRWPGLWTHITSIVVDYDLKLFLRSDFHTAFDQTMQQITSPFIHRISLYLCSNNVGLSMQRSLESWFIRTCNRNVDELELIWPYYCYSVIILPAFVFRTPSLVSIELRGNFGVLDEGNAAAAINLPNLKKLTLKYDDTCKKNEWIDEKFIGAWPLEHRFWEESAVVKCATNHPNLKKISLELNHEIKFGWIENLITGCPFLQELSLVFDLDSSWRNGSRLVFKCTSSSLRRLSIDFTSSSNIVVIDAPNLDYLSAHASFPTQVRFHHEPMLLREARLEFRIDTTGPMSKFFKAISNVTRLTLDFKLYYNLGTMLRFLEHCPALDVLVLSIGSGTVYNKKWIDPKHELKHSLERVKRIDIIDTRKSGHVDYDNHTQYISELVKYLLMNALALEKFNFRVAGKEIERDEISFCELLYKCPKVSLGCEVEFVGRYLTMSRNAGPKLWRANGEVINVDCQ